MIKSVYHDLKITPQVIKAADNETLNGAGVDMSGYEGVAFVAYALKGEILAITMKAQQDTDAAYGTAADLLGTSLSLATTVGADGIALLDIKNPTERYVRPVITMPDATTAKSLAVIAIQYNGRTLPEVVTHLTGAEFHVSPAEGTA